MKSRDSIVLAVFTLSIFVSATLLFVVQPMMAKMISPLLGGVPAIWNTCMVFFQGTLLLGYVYAHGLARKIPARIQPFIHLGVLAIGLLSLPLALPSGADPPGEPTWWLMGTLIVVVGAPFFAISATAPLFQSWFARVDHPMSEDPYPLYAASNLGSIIALLGYPLFFEGAFDVSAQSQMWRWVYIAFIGLAAITGAILWRRLIISRRQRRTTPEQTTPSASQVTWRDRGEWLFLSALPSALSLGVTSYISTDLAGVPMLWVLPLTLYLLTFVIAFGRRSIVPRAWLMASVAPLALAASYTTLAIGALPTWVVLPLHLVAFFCLALAFHLRLVERSPEAADLTGFYMWMSLGGVLGGAFATLAAPIIFNGPYEYPLALAVAALAVPHDPGWEEERSAFATKVLLAATAILVAVRAAIGADDLEMYTLSLSAERALEGLFVLSVCVIVAGMFRGQRFARLAMASGILLTVGLVNGPLDSAVVYQERSFFASHSVRIDDTDDQKVTLLEHGTTVHGTQLEGRPDYPTAYHHMDGPLGDVFSLMQRRRASGGVDVGVVGLGAGATAAYVRDGDTFDFYEIDPVVVDIAKDTRYFTFLERCGGRCNIILGDGRIKLREREDARYDLLILDAFSSDSVPVFLITLEAVSLYVDRISPGGMIAFNISNRYLDLAPVFASHAESLGLVGRVEDYAPHDESDLFSAAMSTWVVLARDEADLAGLTPERGWSKLPTHTERHAWTDQRHDLLSVYTWQ